MVASFTWEGQEGAVVCHFERSGSGVEKSGRGLTYRAPASQALGRKGPDQVESLWTPIMARQIRGQISPLRPIRLRSGQALRPPVEMTRSRNNSRSATVCRAHPTRKSFLRFTGRWTRFVPPLVQESSSRRRCREDAIVSQSARRPAGSVRMRQTPGPDTWA